MGTEEHDRAALSKVVYPQHNLGNLHPTPPVIYLAPCNYPNRDQCQFLSSIFDRAVWIKIEEIDAVFLSNLICEM